MTIEIQFVTRRGRFVNVVTFWEEEFIPFNCKEVSDPCYSVFWEYRLWEVVNEATIVSVLQGQRNHKKRQQKAKAPRDTKSKLIMCHGSV